MNTKETRLQQGITELRTRLLVMSASVGMALDGACAALASGNTDQAEAIIDGDTWINSMENEIDELALDLLALNQPVAYDVRFLVGALRMVIDLERIGDEAVSIAERSIIMQTRLEDPVKGALQPLLEKARELFAEATEVFRASDTEAAMRLCRDDDESTRLEVGALQRIMDFVRADAAAGKEDAPYPVMQGILICRALNRVCRRCANIAGHTYFIARGVNVKHLPHELREAKGS
ncbi:MAG: phosphate signaling complex protein PhoU [Desulfovibrio sp.]|jgi:phosphate transport system protein|nr:phosphate signaling complex protein PhoU [Desulfovibrio sp.]